MSRVRLAFVTRFAPVSAAVLAVALSSNVSAQQRAPARTQEPATTERPATPRTNERDVNADVSITARVTADSLRFEKAPNPRVEFTGRPRRDTVWEAERENLPPQVQPGVTYRDVGITLRITSVFADIDRIVAEALGEVPTGDEPQPTPAQPSPTPPERPAVPAASTTTSKTPHANTAATTPRRRPARRGRVN